MVRSEILALVLLTAAPAFAADSVFAEGALTGTWRISFPPDPTVEGNLPFQQLTDSAGRIAMDQISEPGTAAELCPGASSKTEFYQGSYTFEPNGMIVVCSNGWQFLGRFKTDFARGEVNIKQTKSTGTPRWDGVYFDDDGEIGAVRGNYQSGGNGSTLVKLALPDSFFAEGALTGTWRITFPPDAGIAGNLPFQQLTDADGRTAMDQIGGPGTAAELCPGASSKTEFYRGSYTFEPPGTAVVCSSGSQFWGPFAASLASGRLVIDQTRSTGTPRWDGAYFDNDGETGLIRGTYQSGGNGSTLVQLPAPVISVGGIISANLAPKVETISPLSIFSIFGSGFTTETVLYPNIGANGQLERILGNTCLEMNGERLPLFAATPTQINAQASEKQLLGPATFVVVSNCGEANALRSEPLRITSGKDPARFLSSVSGSVMVEKATPVFFLYPPQVNGGFLAARFNLDNVAVAPAGMFTDQFGPSRPAKPGDVIVLYGTGWGETTAGLAAGVLATGAAEVLPSANRTVSFGGIVMNPADVFYVGVTPQAVGLYQLAIRVPANAAAGNNQVVLTVYGKSTPVGPVVPVVAP